MYYSFGITTVPGALLKFIIQYIFLSYVLMMVNCEKVAIHFTVMC